MMHRSGNVDATAGRIGDKNCRQWRAARSACPPRARICHST